MPPRKTLDIDHELAALLARADKLKTDQKLMLGELVLETGVHKYLDADQIRDALIRARDHAKATPAPAPAPEESRSDAAAATFPAPADTPAKATVRTEPEPARQRLPDLLAGAAPGRAGHRQAAEDTGNGRAS